MTYKTKNSGHMRVMSLAQEVYQSRADVTGDVTFDYPVSLPRTGVVAYLILYANLGDVRS